MKQIKKDIRTAYQNLFDEIQDIEQEVKTHIPYRTSEEEEEYDDDETLANFYKDRLPEVNNVLNPDNKPVNFLPAISTTSAHNMPQNSAIDRKLINIAVMEVETRLTADTYMVCYIIPQKGCFHITCRWYDIFDFVWNGVEDSTDDEYVEIKPYFRKKYPKISDIYGIKVDENDIPRPYPYIGHIGLDNQPREWWISVKILDLTKEDFWKIYKKGIASYEKVLSAIDDLRESCIDIYNEINRSDAKTPKSRMLSYFGNLRLRKADLVDFFED